MRITKETLNIHQKKDFNIKIFLFGSSIKYYCPNDIDILIIYEGDVKNPKNRQVLSDIKTRVKNRVKEVINFNVDFVSLSTDEYNSLEDYKNIDKILLWSS